MINAPTKVLSLLSLAVDEPGLLEPGPLRIGDVEVVLLAGGDARVDHLAAGGQADAARRLDLLSVLVVAPGDGRLGAVLVRDGLRRRELGHGLVDVVIVGPVLLLVRHGVRHLAGEKSLSRVVFVGSGCVPWRPSVDFGGVGFLDMYRNYRFVAVWGGFL